MRTRQQLRVHTPTPVAVATTSDTTAIDPVEARWAAEAVGSLARHLSADSLVAMVLQQAQRELNSLAVSSEPAQVFGPVRLRVVA
jgi:hypothetical protein